MSISSDLVKQINKLLGVEAVKLASDPSLVVEYLPTGVLPVDSLLGGGLPLGRTVEIFGNYSTLKSFIGLNAIAQAQAVGVAALIDTEHAFDPEWAVEIGVNVDDLIYMTPDNGEAAVDVTEGLLRSGSCNLVVWDSVAASLPQAEYEKSMQDKHQPARLAAFMSRSLRKLTAANKKTSLLFINQTREKVGIVYGSPETTPGGKSLPFYASYRLALRKAGSVKRDAKSWDGDQMKSVKETYAVKIRATLEKSKLSVPHRDVYFTFDLDTASVDDLEFLISYGIEHGLITKTGRKWTYGDHESGSAKDFKEWLSDSEAMDYLRELALKH